MCAASMTGFGQAELKLAGKSYAIEIASVNQKNLQVSVYGPEEWPTLESVVSNFIRQHLHRGKVTVRLNSADFTNRTSSHWDENNLKALYEEFQQLAKKLNVPVTPDANLLLSLSNVRSNSRSNLPSFEECEKEVLSSLESAVKQLMQMREAEGQTLTKDLKARLIKINQLVDVMQESEKEAPKRHRDLMLKRLKDMGLELDLADERVLKEITLWADRCDITEEIVRLKSHLQQFNQDLDGEKNGRKLDFLVQELLREANTVGSKASEIATTRAVLEVKTEIERIREQVQNLE
jgi:uncharacterized protein (TIGR00255 family)